MYADESQFRSKVLSFACFCCLIEVACDLLVKSLSCVHMLLLFFHRFLLFTTNSFFFSRRVWIGQVVAFGAHLPGTSVLDVECIAVFFMRQENLIG